MPFFTALNVEPDDSYEEVIDNSREIRLEEAFKLYSNALKLHAQGPKFYDEAAKAYEQLFEAEIVKSAESLIATLEDAPAIDQLEAITLDVGYLQVVEDDGLSTLPQLLYLAYKNHGQFLVDSLKQALKSGVALSPSVIAQRAKQVLERFTLALVQDESDTELWRRTANIGQFLGSKSIARYCLEAALEVDDDPALGEVDPANLEEAYAGSLLYDLLNLVLCDDVALTHPIISPYKENVMSPKLWKHRFPYPFLTSVEHQLESERGKGIVVQPEPAVFSQSITLDSRPWQATASAILSLYPNEDPMIDSLRVLSPGSIVKFTLKDADVIMAGIKSPVHVAIRVPDKESHTPSEQMQVDDMKPQPADIGDEKAQSSISPTTAAHKRSLSTAGLPEVQDEESGRQQRTKRMTTRKRETIGGETIAPIDPEVEMKADCERRGDGDEYLFKYTGDLLRKFNVDTLGSAQEVKDCVIDDIKAPKDVEPRNLAIYDVRSLVSKCDPQFIAAYAAANGLDIMASGDELRNSGLQAFIEDSKTESLKAQAHAPTIPASHLAAFIKSVNEHNWTIDEVGYNYFKALTTSYRYSLWPTDLKKVIVHLLMVMGPSVEYQLEQECSEAKVTDKVKYSKLEETAEMLLELHLDLYTEMTKTTSTVNIEVRQRQKSRLDKCYELVQRVNGDSMSSDNIWRLLHISSVFCDLQEEGIAGLCSGLIQLLKADSSRPGRFWRNVWASFLYFSIHDGVSRDFMICCWSALRSAILNTDPDMKITLNNNAAMPEVSAAAADRELSILTTMDAFLNVFDNIHPVKLIERVEPVVDDQAKYLSQDGAGDQQKELARNFAYAEPMRKFLHNKGPALRLYLWQRLRDAYQQIRYPTKVFSCHLRCMEIIAAYIQSAKFKETPEASRQKELLGYLKVIDEILVKALTLALNDPTAFEIIDEEHLKTSMEAVASICRLLQGITLIHDQYETGLLGSKNSGDGVANDKFPLQVANPKKFFRNVSESTIRAWALLYTLIKEGIQQHKDLFKTVDDDLAEYLAVVHYSLGLRNRCDYSNKIFLKMMKVELIKMEFVDRWEDYLGQVLHDLYGLTLSKKIGIFEIHDHKTEREKLDRRTAISIINHVTVLAHRMSMKEVIKDELSSTIQAMHAVIGPAKSNIHSAHNLRIINDYLKSTINPIEINKGIKGLEVLDTQPVKSNETYLAEKGWYFLIGMMALTKFRSVKRTAPGGLDDLKLATGLLRTQLQYCPEDWETWYRLAQCYDSELEEDVLWSSEKLNDDRAAIALLQRSAIHCYSMALSCAMRNAKPSFETAEKMSCLYHDYGVRLYASSREPFTMEAFFTDGQDRHMSGTSGMYKVPVHQEISKPKAWKLAAYMLKKALEEKPNNWLTHYMLAKCYWKIYIRGDNSGKSPMEKKRLMTTLIDTLEKAVQNCPKPRDSRVEPILEPHYKIVVILYKLVSMDQPVDLQDAADRIQRGRYAIKKGARIEVPDLYTWNSFISDSIKHLRSLDKSNWQHRFIYRTAQLAMDRSDHPYGELTTEAAAAASKIMTSGIFSKTMVVSVWKPELERAGRHCVYMSRYVKKMIEIQYKLQDKAGMEMLIKRARRKSTEYFEFDKVWEYCCLGYIKIIRITATLGEDRNLEAFIKAVPAEDFEDIADALEKWAEDPPKGDNETFDGRALRDHYLAFEALKDGVDLRKVNAGQMKSMPIDDLIADAYAYLIYKVARFLPRPQRPKSVTVIRPAEPQKHPNPMAMNSIVASIEGSVAQNAPIVEVIEHVRKAKHPTRREILRRAELLVTRAGEKEKGKSESRRGGDDKRKSISSIVKQSTEERENETNGDDEDEDEDMEDPDSSETVKALNNEERERDRESTGQRSLHDEADDESDSDLSDVPEDLDDTHGHKDDEDDQHDEEGRDGEEHDDEAEAQGQGHSQPGMGWTSESHQSQVGAAEDEDEQEHDIGGDETMD